MEEQGHAPVEKASRSYKDQIKMLKERRGPAPKEQMEELKARNKIQATILSAIATEAKTVPEIARATGVSAQEVFWWITALRKYDRVLDEGKRGDYFAYRKK